MLHELMRIWFQWVEQWGYTGVFLLMAMESSILPVPSEVVMPPAAFWATQGRMDFWGVILAGTAGSYFGSIINYGLARWLGFPIFRRYGKYVFMPPEKIRMAEVWVQQFGTTGIFLARLLPVIRHLISIPAGVFRMRWLPFSLATTIGAGLWCTVLAWFGREVIGDRPELLQSPDVLGQVMKDKLHWFVGAVVVLGILYGFVVWFKGRSRARADAPEAIRAEREP